jgi:hypothetical protein
MFQEKTNNYKAGRSENKKKCRNMFLNAFTNSNFSTLRYVGLPALNPELEISFLKIYEDAEMYLVEINPFVFAEQKQIFPRPSNLNPYQYIYHTRDNIFRCSIPFKMNAVWFDLCGMIKPEMVDNLIQFNLQNNFQKEGIFAITFQSTRERKSNKGFYYALQMNYLHTEYETLRDFRKEGIPRVFMKIVSDTLNAKVQVIENFIYVATKVQMQFMLFKWTKLS